MSMVVSRSFLTATCEDPECRRPQDGPAQLPSDHHFGAGRGSTLPPILRRNTGRLLVFSILLLYHCQLH